jgi:ATP-dependent helicase/nuclease subunit A
MTERAQQTELPFDAPSTEPPDAGAPPVDAAAAADPARGARGDGWPPDAAARERIHRDLNASLLVEAGAGSGKTTAMVGRMVALVRTGAATVDQIAAVTFTRKAAAELRERFQEALEEAFRDPSAADDERHRIGRALRDIDRCFVGTIHAFCGRLLRERPLEAGVPPGFREVSGPEEDRLRAEAWAHFLEHLAARGSRLPGRLAAVGIAPAGLRDAFRDVSDNPDVRWSAPAAPRPGAAEVAPVRAALERLLERSWARMPAEEPAGGWDPLQSKVRTLRFSRYVLGWDDSVPFLDALATAIGSQNRVTQNRWGADRETKAAAKELCAAWDDFAAEQGPAATLLRRWREHRYPVAVRFARAAAAFYARERFRAGALGFQDLLVLTARLLRTHPEVRRELGERYRHLLVDEFQDTDPIQAEVVFLLAADPSQGSDWRTVVPRPGGLFVVGDPKQSIYRFRRADIGVYEQVKQRFGEFGAVLRLVANFRSTRPVERLVNRVFGDDGLLPPRETPHQAAFAPLRVPPDADGGGVGWYDVTVEGGRAGAARLADAEAPRLAAWIEARIEAGERRPGDFMIVTTLKKPLGAYARALEARGIPTEVSGAAVGMEDELHELVLLLRALADPGNPVPTLAVLEGLFFGLSHEDLYAHAAGGGGFAIASSGRTDGAVEDALEVLRRYHGWSLAEPADVAVPRIVDDLGLLAYAAAGPLGGPRAGALVYALDALRVAGLEGRTSLAEAVEVLDAALGAEADAPLEPGREDVVRVMNLHKAKGLEAKVVILACPTTATEHAVRRHVARLPTGEAVGYLQVCDATRAMGAPVIAEPRGWDAHAEAERPFEAAEDVRLLYVAATRAAEELLVARCEKTEETACWAPLHAALADPALAAEVVLPEPADAMRPVLTTPADTLRTEVEALQAARAALARPSCIAASVTARVKGAPDAAGVEASPSREGRGMEWGVVVHRTLEAAARGMAGAALEAAARGYLRDAERPLDAHGEPEELPELLGLVAGIRGSALWARAARAERLFAEMPFAVELSPAALAEHGLAGEEGPPRQIVEGVIDLVFRDAKGWVLADYKTDVFADEASRRARVDRYRRQVDLYADCWTHLTGEAVSERVLVFTSEGREERW